LALVREIEGYASVDFALRAVKAHLSLTEGTEAIPTAESYGRISATNIVSPKAIPSFDTSHMDGFAVIANDLEGATEPKPVVLKISGEVRLGSEPTKRIRHGEAVRVFTGSAIPPRGDTVLPMEHVKQGQKTISVRFVPRRGNFVYPKGRDFRQGKRVLKKGQAIRAQDVGMLLSIGWNTVTVRSRPKVSLIATGSELTDNPKKAEGKMINSHAPYFLALIRALGCTPLYMGIARDDPAEVARMIRSALSKSDFVLTLGGTSVGRADLVGDAVGSLKPDVAFHGIKMDRGRVTGVAAIGGKPLLMMPGPVQGAMNAFVLFGTKIIGWLSGNKTSELEVSCRLQSEWEARKRFSHFTKVLYVKAFPRENMAQPLIGETESIKIMSQADGYVVVPEKVTRLERGSMVRVRLLPGFSFV
jgi:molybdopterin molybdotransferase